MKLEHLGEDDVVELFKAGLRTFLKAQGGAFGSRRATLREERIFPSDQEFAVRFDSPNGFRLHLFGLQFKRWSDKGWALSEVQLTNLRQAGHVIGYCLPCPADLVPSNSLHGFYFINPQAVPEGSKRLTLFRPGIVVPLGVTPAKLASAVQSRLDMQVSMEDFLRKRPSILDRPAPGEILRALRKIIRDTGSTVKQAATELQSAARVYDGQTWGASAVGATSESEACVPHLSWGDFFHAALEGSWIIDVPGSPESPPDLDADPDSNGSPATGMGLTINCSGVWGQPWAVRQISDHLEHWTRSLLESPAAVIAYESFSRSLEFIEFIG
jgi:hypothetical protein